MYRASYNYEVKAYVKLSTPIVVALFLSLPVAAAWIAVKRVAKENQSKPTPCDAENPAETGAQQDINWQQRYDRTVDVFWNNFMFWIFREFPLFQHLRCSGIVERSF